MAPNLQQLSFLSDDGADNALAHITALVQQKLVTTVRTSQQHDTTATAASSSYWDWPATATAAVDDADATKDLFSANHLVDNLVQEAATVSSGGTITQHDDYWAEASSIAASDVAYPHVPFHLVQDTTPTTNAMASSDVPVNYWDEATPARANAVDAYWREASASSQPADYWDERHYGTTDSLSDLYWAEYSDRSTTAKVVTNSCRLGDSYWHEASHGLSFSDRYWSMATVQ